MTGTKHKQPFKKKAPPSARFTQAKQHGSRQRIAIWLLVAAAISSVATANLLNAGRDMKAVVADDPSDYGCPWRAFLADWTRSIVGDDGHSKHFWSGVTKYRQKTIGDWRQICKG